MAEAVADRVVDTTGATTYNILDERRADAAAARRPPPPSPCADGCGRPTSTGRLPPPAIATAMAPLSSSTLAPRLELRGQPERRRPE